VKRFQFNLEKVLRVRGHETDIAMQHVAAALLELSRCQHGLRKAGAALEALEDDWRQQTRARRTVNQWHTHNLLHEALVEAKLLAAEAVVQAQAMLAARRLELAEARRREKVLESLKDRQLAVYTQESLAEEQKETDEVAQNMRLVWKEAASR
jgi:flagellar export protein FliJ